MFVPVCPVDPGAGEPCPSASLAWVAQTVFSVFPELSPGGVSDLGAAILVLFVVAFGIRIVLRQFKV